jgi:hypothetical protein
MQKEMCLRLYAYGLTPTPYGLVAPLISPLFSLISTQTSPNMIFSADDDKQANIYDYFAYQLAQYCQHIALSITCSHGRRSSHRWPHIDSGKAKKGAVLDLDHVVLYSDGVFPR